MKIITFMKEMTGRISPDKSNNPDMNVTYYIQSFIIDILYIIIQHTDRWADNAHRN